MLRSVGEERDRETQAQNHKRKSGRLVVMGLGIGLALSLATNRLLASQLFGLSPHDPLLLTTVSLLLLLVALLASFLPARRAARVDPMEALRYE
jgi:ABC-type antimicrobial peptide transport system permease subunit